MSLEVEGGGTPAVVEGPTDGVNIPTQDEIQDSSSDLETALTNIQTAQRSLVALERLQSSLESFAGQPITPRAGAFLHDAYSYATAGLENIVEELPALECYGLQDSELMRSVSVETIGSAIRRTIEMVLNSIARLAKMLSEMLAKIAPNLQMLRFKAYQARLLSHQVAGRFPEVQQLPLGFSGTLASTELKPIATGGDLITNLNELNDQFGIVSGEYLRNVSSLQSYYIRRLSDLKDADSDEDVQKLLNELATQIAASGPSVVGGRFRSQKKIADARFPNNRAVSAAPLPGHRSIVIVSPAESDEANPISGLLDQHLDLTRLNPSVVKDYAASQMKTMLPTEINEALNLIDKLIARLVEALKGGERMRVNDMAKAVKRASEELEGRYEGRQGPMAELISSGATLSSWVAAPYMPMISLAVSVSTASLRLITQHIRSYGVDEQKA